MGIRASKVTFYEFLQMSYLKLQNTATRMRLNNRLNLLLHTV